MSREIELRRLPMSDQSVVVLTTLHVYHHKDKGMFGEDKTAIRHGAITSVQIGWKRSEALLWSGIILLALWLFLWLVAVMIGGPEIASDQQAPGLSGDGNLALEQQLFQYVERFFSSGFASMVKYASLLAGIGALALFGFHRRSEVQITSAGAAIKGSPKNYEEGCRFCERLLTIVEEDRTPAKKEEPPKTTDKGEKPSEKEWRL